MSLNLGPRVQVFVKKLSHISKAAVSPLCLSTLLFAFVSMLIDVSFRFNHSKWLFLIWMCFCSAWTLSALISLPMARMARMKTKRARKADEPRVEKSIITCSFNICIQFEVEIHLEMLPSLWSWAMRSSKNAANWKIERIHILAWQKVSTTQEKAEKERMSVMNTFVGLKL